MADKVKIPTSGLGGLALLGGAAALTWFLWPKKAAAGGSGGGGGAGGGGGGASVPFPSAGTTGGAYPSTSRANAGTSSGGASTVPEELTPPTDYPTDTTTAGNVEAGGSTWYLPGGQTGPSWYNGLGDLGDDSRSEQYAALASQVQSAQAEIDSAYANWSAGIFTRLVGGTQNVVDMVTSSDALAAALVSALQELSSNPDATYDDGSRKAPAIESVAARYVGGANAIVQTIGSQSFSTETIDFLTRFPSSLHTVVTSTVNAAGDVVAGAAWGLGKTVLVLGLAAAAVGFLLSRSGVSIDAGPVKLQR